MNGRNPHELPLAQALTPREQEILTCIAAGLTNRQIAERLTIAMSTVKWYVRQIYNKLGVESRAQAIIRAQFLGLVSARELENNIRHNLPVAATSFVGRVQELDALATLIADPQVRIITIVGPGGMGKTRLALEAARRQVDSQTDFPDGVFFVELAPLETAVEITATIAATIDFQFQGTQGETKQLLNYLRQKQMLLVMDNFEHILGGRTLSVEINEWAAGITLLVTSRAQLQLRGEQLFPLGGLEMAQFGKTIEEVPAARLFLNIARRTVPDYQLLEGDTQHLLRICWLVGGMPLGLELAASWVGLLPLSKIVAEIEQSLGLLATEHHDVPQRHQSMEATLDLSWGRLTAEQQRAFQEITVFRGGFTRTAALEIAGVTLPLLVILANKSWLSYDQQKDCYHIHTLLRQYGASILCTKPARERAVRDKHSAYFCGYLKKREKGWIGTRQTIVAAEIRDEIENIQSAWRWATSQENSVLLAQGLKSLCHFYLWECRMIDGQNACRSAEEALSKSLSGGQADDSAKITFRSQVLAWEWYFVEEGAFRKKILTQSEQLLDSAATEARNTRAERAFLFLTKLYDTMNRDVNEAMSLANRSLVLFRQLSDRWGEAEVLTALGICHLYRGDFDLVNTLLRNSLKIRQYLCDTQGTLKVTTFLGLAAGFQGNFAEAETLHRQSVTLSQQLGIRSSERMCLSHLSYTLSWAGKFHSAREVARSVLKLNQDFALFPSKSFWFRVSLIMINIHLGHFSQGRASATESLEFARQNGLSGEISWALMCSGNIAFVEGDLGWAKNCLLESVATQAEFGHISRALSQACLSYVLRAQDEGRSARDYLAGALHVGIESQSVFPIMYSLPASALLAADEGRPERAIELYGVAQQFLHITNSRWFADVACRELDGVYASLPAEEAEAAAARGRELDVWATAVSLLQELNGH